MSDEQRRVAYFAHAVEMYKKAKNQSGREAFAYLRRFGADQYIYDMFELLHVHGTEYLLEDIDGYIRERQNTALQSAGKRCATRDVPPCFKTLDASGVEDFIA